MPARKKSAALKAFDGNPGQKPIPKQIIPPAGELRPPTWIPAEAKREWRRVLPLIQRVAYVSPIDRAVFTSYCVAWARLVEAEKQLNKDGVTIEGHRGVRSKHPAFVIARQASQQMLTAAKELGLTPSSREGVLVPALFLASTETDDEDELYLFGE